MSKIEWTNETWNPIIGCDKISAGCKNCYAIRTAWIRMHNPKMAARYAGTVEKTAVGELNWTGKLNLVKEVLHKPLDKKKPSMYFVNSMSDLFHDAVPFEFIDTVYDTMDAANWHIFQVLTKRPKRMLAYYEWKAEGNGLKFSVWPLKNVWIGVSVEDQKAACDRIPDLLKVSAAVRFLSCEPLLGSVDLSDIGIDTLTCDVLSGCTDPVPMPINTIDWVIVGGESGPAARPMHPDWARQLRDQCKDAGVPFFFKQWGAYKPTEEDDTEIAYAYNDGTMLTKPGKKKAGRLLDGKLHDEFPV